MANTYKLIEAKTLSSDTASITFTSITSTYTDLKLLISARQGGENAFNIRFNSDSGSNYTYIMLGGNGSSADSGVLSGNTEIRSRGINPNTATASTFGNTEIYIPNYANASYYKSVSVDGVNENNATEIYCSLVAGIWNSTSAITSITISPRAGNLVQYSNFYLYGIKNS